MKHRFKIIPAALAAMLLSACQEEPMSIMQPKDSVPPGELTDIRVVNIPGGADIYYSLPADEDALYVKGTYRHTSGTVKEAVASIYANKLTIEGLGNTDPVDVELVCVDRSRNVSKAVGATIEPLTTPLDNVVGSASIIADFGGVNFSWANPAGLKLVVTFFKQDEKGNLAFADNIYTQQLNGNFSLRGFTSEESHKFGMVIKDQWNNYSDTLRATVTPIFEELIPKSGFTKMFLTPPNGDIEDNWGWQMQYLWDDNTLPESTGYHTGNATTETLKFTFDTGKISQLSRFTVWHRSVFYTGGNIKKWEVWGRPDAPGATGEWDGWTKLLDCESVKPSGLPGTESNDLDLEYAARGEEFLFPISCPAVRYIRFNIIETWGGNYFANIIELSFWGGNPAEN